MAKKNGLWLPREGFTVDVVARLIKGTLLAPNLTLPLFLLGEYTAQGNNLTASHPAAFKALKVLLYLGLARSVNKWLSRRALNNGVSDTYDWPREIAVVTGGSDGIGREITLRLAKRGLKVVVLDVQPLKYNAPSNVHFFNCDIRTAESVAQTAEEIRTTVGDPTILINNAGVLKGKTILDATDAEIRQTFDVNTVSHYWLARQFLPSLIAKNHGMVVTIASQASFITSPTMVEYSASKAAAVAFHEGLGTELRTRFNAPKVRTVLLTQGFVRTSLVDVLTPEDTFVNPLLEPETVAEAVVGQVLTGSSGQIVMPEVTGFVAQNIRSFPHWFQNRVTRQDRDGWEAPAEIFGKPPDNLANLDLFGKSSSRSSVSSSSKSSHRRRRRTEAESDAGLNNNNDNVDDDTVSKSSSHRKSKSRSKSKPSSSSSSSTVHRSRRSDDRDLDAEVDVARSTISSSSRRRRHGGDDDGDDGMARSAVSSYATADSFFPVNDDGASQSQLGIDPVYDYTDDGRSQNVKRHRRRQASSEADGNRDRSRGSVESREKEDREERRRRRREKEEREERQGEEKRDYKRYSRKLNGEEIVEVIEEEPEPEQGEALSRAVPSSPEVSPYEASRSNAPQSPSDVEDTSRAPGIQGPPFQQQYGYNGPSNNPGNMYAPPAPEAPNSAGLAADYYNDQGQSVSTQPGLRPGDDVPSFQAIPQPLPVNPVQAPMPQPSTVPPPLSPEPFSPASHEQPQQPSPQIQPPYSPYSQPSHQPTHSQDSSSHSGLGPIGTAGVAAAGVAAATHHAHHHDSANHGFQTGSLAFGPKQRQGPLRKFVNFWKDPDGVAQFEEYSEITGVCKDCFEPGTTSKDAPRRHRRKRSDDRLQKRGKIDKLTRYASSDEESHHKSSKRKSWLAAGLAAYVGKSLFDNQSSSSSGSESSAGKRSRTSRGKIQMSEHDQASVIYRPDASENQSVISGNSRSTDRRTKSDGHHRHHRSSSFSSAASSKRSSGLGLGTAAIAAAAAGSGAVIASKSRRKSRSRSKSPRRPRRTASLSSSSFSDVSRPRGAGMSSFSTFFSAPSENARRGRPVRTKKKRKGGFFGFGGSSYYSSSDDADLAFGSEMFQRSGKRGKSKKSDEDIDAKLLALGAAATSIAAASQSNGKRRADVYAVKERPGKSKYTATGDDDWISASSSSESSGVDSALAFGSSRHSKESLSSDSVASKWRWRWGGRKKRPKPIDTSDQKPGSQDVYPPASDHRNSLQSIAAIDPVPASDSPMIDSSRNAISSSTVPLVAAGMALSGASQSQSTVPAPQPFYAPSEPIMQTAGPGPAPGVSRASTEPINHSEPHEFSHRDYVQQQREQDYDYTPRRIPRKEMTEIRRRDTSPVFSSSQPEEDLDARLPKRSASVREVQFDLTQEQAEKERRQARLDRERESQRYQPSARPGLSDKDLASIEYITDPEDLEGDHSSARKMGEVYDQHDTSPSSSSWVAPAVDVPVIKVSDGTGFVPDLDGGYKKRRRDERREERRKHRRFYTDSDVSSIKHTDPASPSDSEEISERNRRIAKKAARRVDITPPTYDSYVDYFTPEELRHSSAEHSPRSGSVEDLGRVPKAESPSARFEREYAAHSSSRGGELSLPWPVPRLNLIEPTPPHSVASSIVMSDLESDERRDLPRESRDSHTDYEDTQSAEPPMPDNAVPVVPIYEIPVHKEFEIEDVTETVQPDPVSTQSLERDIDTPQEHERWAPPSGPLESQLISDSPQRQHVPGGFEDDLEFAATLAAGASIAGFDTAIVTEDPTYYRRTSPPGSETEDNKPAAFIIEREAEYEVPPTQGFVEERSLPASDTEEHVQPKDIPLPASTVGYTEPEDASELQRNIDHTTEEPTKPTEEVEKTPVKLSKKERRRLKAAQLKNKGIDKDEPASVEETQPEQETISAVDYPAEPHEAATEPKTVPSSDNQRVEEYERSRDVFGPEREILGSYDDNKAEEVLVRETGEQNGGTPDSFETAHSIESDRETIVPVDIGSRALDDGKAFDVNEEIPRHTEQESYQHQSIPGAFGDSNSSEAEVDTVAAAKVAEAQVPTEPEPEPEKKPKRKSKKKKRRDAQEDKAEDDTPREPEETQSFIPEGTTEKVIESTEVAEPTEITEPEGLERGASKSKRRSKRYSELIESQTDIKEPEQVVDDASSVISSAKSNSSKSKKKSGGGFLGFFSSSKSEVAADKEPAAEERTRDIPDDAVSVKSHKSRQSIEQDEAEGGATEKATPDVDEDGKKESRKEKKKKKKRKNRYEHIVESGAATEQSEKDGDRDQGDPKQSEDEYASSKSFLGDSPEMPLASDGASGQDSALVSEEPAETVAAPEVEIQPESGLPPRESNRPASPQPAEDLTKISSRPSTPPLSSSVENEDAMKTPRDRTIGVVDTTSPASTKVPLQFRRRGSSVLSFAGRSAPTSPVERRQRPKSTEFKTSREFRPLWLVEQHSTNKPEEPQDEPYPSLPSSKTTSRSSSIEDLRTASYDDFISGIPSSRPRRNSLRIGTAGTTFDTDVLGSQQATPTAATFKQQLQDPPSESKDKPKYQFHTPSELLEDPMITAEVPDSQDREIPSSPHGSVIHIGAEKDLDVEDLPALPASPAEPLAVEEQLPSLPESRPSSSHSNPITEIAVGEEGEENQDKIHADMISTDRVISEEVSEDLPALPESRPSSPVEEIKEVSLPDQSTQGQTTEELPALPESRPSSPVEGEKEEASPETHNEAAIDTKLSPPETPAESDVSFVDALESPGEAAFDGGETRELNIPPSLEEQIDDVGQRGEPIELGQDIKEDGKVTERDATETLDLTEDAPTVPDEQDLQQQEPLTTIDEAKDSAEAEQLMEPTSTETPVSRSIEPETATGTETTDQHDAPPSEEKKQEAEIVAQPATTKSKKKKNKRKNRSVDVAVDTPSVETPEVTEPVPLVENKEAEMQENVVGAPSVPVDEAEEKKLDDTTAPQEMAEPVQEAVEKPAEEPVGELVEEPVTPAAPMSKKKKKKQKNRSVDVAVDAPSVETLEATESEPLVENKETDPQENTVETPSVTVEAEEKKLDDVSAPEEMAEPVEEPVEELITPAAPVSKKKKKKQKNRSVDVAVDTPSAETLEAAEPEPLVESKETESQENAVETPSIPVEAVETEEKKLDDTPAPQEIAEPVEEPATPAASGSKKKKKKAKAKAKAEAEAKAKEQEQEQQRKREQEQEHQHDQPLDQDQTEKALQPEATESTEVSPPVGVENTDTTVHEPAESETITAGDPDQVEPDKTVELPVEEEAPPEAMEEDKIITDADTALVTEESEAPVQSDNIVQDAGQVEADNIPEPEGETEIQPASLEIQQTVTDAEAIPATEETEDHLEPNTAEKDADHDEPREVSEQQQDEFTEAKETVDASDLPAETTTPVVEEPLETAQELPEQEEHEANDLQSEVALPVSDTAEDIPVDTEEAQMTEPLVSEEVQEKEKELETKDLPSEVALPASDIVEDAAVNTEEAQITEPLVSEDIQEKADAGKHPLEDMQDEMQGAQEQPAASSEPQLLDEETKPTEDAFFDSVQEQDVSQDTLQEQVLASPTKETSEDPATTEPVEANTEQVDEGGSKAKKKKAKKAKKKKDRRATVSEPNEPQPSADSEEVNPDNDTIAPDAASELPADNIPEVSPAAEPNTTSQEPEGMLPIDGESKEISDHLVPSEKDDVPELTQISPLEPEEVVTMTDGQAEETQENENAGDTASFKSMPMDIPQLPDTSASTDVHSSQEQDNGVPDKETDVPEPVAEEPEAEKVPIEELPEDKQDNETSEEPTITVEAADTVVGDNAPLAEVDISESQEGPTANDEPPHVTEQTNEEADVLTAPPKLSKKQSKKEKRRQKELQKALNNAALDKNDAADATETAVEIPQDQPQLLESQAKEQEKPAEDMPVSIDNAQKLSEIETEAIRSIESEDKTELENQTPLLDTAEDEKQEPEPEQQGRDLEQEQEQEQITTDNQEVPELETQQQQEKELEQEPTTTDNQEVPEPVDEAKVVEEDGTGIEMGEKKEDTGEPPLDTAAPVETPVVEAPKGKKGKKKKGKKGQKSISLEDEPKIPETVIPQAEEAPVEQPSVEEPVEEPPKEEPSTEQPSMEQTSVEQPSAELEEMEKEQPSVEQTSVEQQPAEPEEVEKEQPSMEQTTADQPSLETPPVESEEAQKEPENEPEQPVSSKSKRKAKKNKKKQKLAEQAAEQEEEQATQQQPPPEVTPPTDITEAQAETDNPEELPATEEKEEAGPIEADNSVSKNDALPSEVEVEQLPQNEDQEVKGSDGSAHPKANDDGKEIQHSKSKKKGKKKNKAKTSDWTDEIPTTQVEKEPVTTLADKSTSEESSQTQHEKIEDSTNVLDDKSQQTSPDDLPPTDPSEPNPQGTETSTVPERAAEPDSNDSENIALPSASVEDTTQIPLPVSPIDTPPSPTIDAIETTSLTTPEGVDGLGADLTEEPVQANEEQREIRLSGDHQEVTTVEPENNTQETTVSADTHSYSEPTQDLSPEEQGKLVSEPVVALQEEPVDSSITVPQEHANSEQTGDSDKTVEQSESDTRAISPEECANSQESGQAAELPPNSLTEPAAGINETAGLSEEGQGQELAMEPADSAASEEIPLDVPVAVESTPNEEASLNDAAKPIEPEAEPPVSSNVDEVDMLAAPDSKKDKKKKKKKNRVTFTEPEILEEEKTEQVDAPVPEVISDGVPNQTEPVETAEEAKPISKKAKKKKKKGKGAVVDTKEGTSKEEQELTPDAERSIDVVEETPVDSVENAQRELPLETADEATESLLEDQGEQAADQQENAQDIIGDQSLEQEATENKESELANETVTPVEAILEDQLADQPESAQEMPMDQHFERDGDGGKEDLESVKETMASTTVIEAPVTDIEEQPANQPESAQETSTDQPLEGDELARKEEPELEKEIARSVEAEVEEAPQESSKSKKKSKKQKKKAKREASAQQSTDEPGESGADVKSSATPEAEVPSEAVEVPNTAEGEEEVQPVEETVKDKEKGDSSEVLPEQILESKSKAQESHHTPKEGDDDQWPAIDWDDARIEATDRSFHEGEPEPVSLDLRFPRDQTPEPQSISPYSFPHRIGAFDANASPVQSLIGNMSDPQVLDATIPRQRDQGKGAPETATFTARFHGEGAAAQSSSLLEKQPDETHLEDTVVDEDNVKREIAAAAQEGEDVLERELEAEVEPIKEQSLEATKSDFGEYPKDQPQEDVSSPVVEKKEKKGGKKGKKSKQKQLTTDATGNDEQPGFDASETRAELDAQPLELETEKADDKASIAAKDESPEEAERGLTEVEPAKEAEDQSLRSSKKKSKKKERKAKKQTFDDESTNEQQHHADLPLPLAQPEPNISAFTHTPVEDSSARSLDIEPALEPIADSRKAQPATTEQPDTEELPRALLTSQYGSGTELHDDLQMQETTTVGFKGLDNDKELPQFSPEPRKEDDVFTDSPRKKRASTRRKSSHAAVVDKPVDRRRSLPMDLGSKSLSSHSLDTHTAQTPKSEARDLRDLSPSPSRQPRSIFGGPYGLAEESRGVSPPKTPLGTIKEHSEPKSPPETRGKGEFQRLSITTGSPRQTTPDLSVPKHRDIVRPRSAGASDSEPSPKLRRVSSARSTDLKAASKRDRLSGKSKSPEFDFAELEGIPSSSTYDPVTDKGKNPLRGMAADVYEGWGDVAGPPLSPTRPPSVRRRRSLQHLQDLETRLDQLASENRLINTARENAERTAEAHAVTQRQQARALQARDQAIQNKDLEIQQLKKTTDWLQKEVARLTEVNDGLTATNAGLQSSREIDPVDSTIREQWQRSEQQLAEIREQYTQLSAGMDNIVKNEVQNALADKEAEIQLLRDELTTTQQKVRELQAQIESSAREDIVVFRDEDYFDNACQKLCQHVQQWVLRFSKFSDMRVCRLTRALRDEKLVERFENAILDGSGVDTYLSDRVKRRDVFMSVVMSMMWEYIFTRYLFGMDREQRQKLKTLEKHLTEVGPPSAVQRWRATTLSLLCRRPVFQEHRESDTEAVVQEIYRTLSKLLPPPHELEKAVQDSLRNVMRFAVGLSIEMRTQRAEYVMLPPLKPEYDANGELLHKVFFNATIMNERSGETTSNEALEEQRAVVRMVLFPLVVKKRIEDGQEEAEEEIICPAQVLVARPGKDKKVGRVPSGDRMSLDPSNRSIHSFISPHPSNIM